MKTPFISLLFILLSSFAIAQQANQLLVTKHVSFLASDKLKGRGTSSKDEKKTAKYIARYFKQYGLEPKGTEGFLYPFTFKKNTNPHDTATTNLPLRRGINVVGFLNNGSEYTIVIGAHMDHLGLGYDYNSLDANPQGKIHNGADDNASGTAGVLELARIYATNNVKEKYNFLFICFSGEELGLLGSKKYCEQPTIDLKTVNYMFNMDMIGRLNDSTNKLMIYGVGTSPTWVPLIEKNTGGFSLKTDSAGVGPSDQTSFYLMNIPVLHFFTGQHSDYHKPTDDAEFINFTGEVKVLNYISQIINLTLEMPKLTFTPTKSKETKSTKFKVTLGVMPDYAFEGKGMRVDGVTEGRPAYKAGVLKGDVIIKIGDTEVKSVEEYMKGLSQYNKGDKTNLQVTRNGNLITLNVEF